MGVPEDDMLGGDLEYVAGLGHRGEARPPDRAHREVRAHRSEPEAVGDPDGAGEGDRAEQPVANARGSRVAAVEHLPQASRRIGPSAALVHSPLGETEEQRVDRRLHPLVLVKRRRLGLIGRLERVVGGGDDAKRALDRGDAEPLDRRHRQMPVEVLAVQRVDAVCEPQAWIGERHPRRCAVAAEGLHRQALWLTALLELERLRSLERAALEPGLDQVMVMVAGDDDDLAAGHRLAQRRHHGLGRRQRLYQRPVAQLEHIAEQNQAFAAIERRQQSRADVLAANHVGAAAEAEVQIGDDRRRHGGIVADYACRVALHPLAENFASVADAYERGRPDYPPAVAGAIGGELGVRPGARILDLAAGTGKLTRSLLAGGYDVVAVEPQAPLREKLAASVGADRVHDGVAEAIPLGAGSVDAVTVADAFHWFDHGPALAEIGRVLVPGGGLALVSMAPDWTGASWADDVGRLIGSLRPEHPNFGGPAWPDVLRSAGGWAEPWDLRITRSVPAAPERIADYVASMSFIAALPDAAREATLERVRELVAAGETPSRLGVHVGIILSHRL